jgi:hypothetical protein
LGIFLIGSRDFDERTCFLWKDFDLILF